MPVSNPAIAERAFLAGMYSDGYFPNHLVDKGKAILLKLCERIEAEQPADDEAVLALTDDATRAFNDLQEEFYEADSEIETAAREDIAENFGFILETYGFGHIDVEEAIRERDW